VKATGRIASYRDLKVWEVGMELAEECYRLTSDFPRGEMFGLTSQIRRSAASIPANIAEGYGRDSKGEYVRFLRVAQGSLKELETHLILASRVGLTRTESVTQPLQITETLGKMLRALYRSLQRSSGDSLLPTSYSPLPPEC
jgi:four helix bundle protein